MVQRSSATVMLAGLPREIAVASSRLVLTVFMNRESWYLLDAVTRGGAQRTAWCGAAGLRHTTGHRHERPRRTQTGGRVADCALGAFVPRSVWCAPVERMSVSRSVAVPVAERVHCCLSSLSARDASVCAALSANFCGVFNACAGDMSEMHTHAKVSFICGRSPHQFVSQILSLCFRVFQLCERLAISKQKHSAQYKNGQYYKLDVNYI